MKYYTTEKYGQASDEPNAIERAVLDRAKRGANVINLIRACRPYTTRKGKKCWANSLDVAELVDRLVEDGYLERRR